MKKAQIKTKDLHTLINLHNKDVLEILIRGKNKQKKYANLYGIISLERNKH